MNRTLCLDRVIIIGGGGEGGSLGRLMGEYVFPDGRGGSETIDGDSQSTSFTSIDLDHHMIVMQL